MECCVLQQEQFTFGTRPVEFKVPRNNQQKLSQMFTRCDSKWNNFLFYLLIPVPMNHGYGRNYHTFYSDSSHMPPFGELCPRSQDNNWHCTVSSKGHLTILSIQLLQDDEEYGKTSGFLECGPTSTFLHFSDCEVSSLIKSNIMWNQYYNDGQGIL